MNEIPSALLNCVTLGDHKELATQIPDESIDLLYTDPPYPKEFLHCFYEMGEYAGRVLKPGGSLLTLCGQWEVPYAIEALSVGLKYHWMGWLLNDQKPTLFGFRVVNGGKPMLWFAKGRPKLDYGFWWDTRHFRGARDKNHHEWGQPIEPTLQDIELFTKQREIVFDPFCGGGTTAAACKITNRQFITFEIDPTQASIATQRIANTNPPLFILEKQIAMPLLQEREEGRQAQTAQEEPVA